MPAERAGSAHASRWVCSGSIRKTLPRVFHRSVVALVAFGALTFGMRPRQANLPTPWIGLWERITSACSCSGSWCWRHCCCLADGSVRTALEPAGFVMTRRMILGLKRAEALATTETTIQCEPPRVVAPFIARYRESASGVRRSVCRPRPMAARPPRDERRLLRKARSEVR